MPSIGDLATPALLIDGAVLDANLRAMAHALPGARLRPHVKAHKCTALARRQAALGHRTFTCATIREVEGLVAAGLGEDVLLANEVVDARRLGALDARVTVAVDSEETIDAAATGGVREVLIDLNVGLPRCGCDPADAARLAARARTRGLTVRGVMGYEGHAMLLPDRAKRAALVAQASEQLATAHAAVGGAVVSTGGTGTFDLHTVATEIQAGSYALMDTAYKKLELPFAPAFCVLGTVVSTSTRGYAVADVGLKALGMDHGPSAIADAQVIFFSDEHVTFTPERRVRVGDRVRVWPAHVDPTMAYHERAYVVDGERVVDTWLIDLRGW